MKTPDAPQCPYIGLRPYTEADRQYFFGRDRDQRIITSNLYGAPLTVLYGASGVGKSSVLLAGVVPKLREKQHIAVVVFRNWQDPNIMEALKNALVKAVNESAGESIAVDFDKPFNEVLVEATRALRGLVFFVFDQFEEYFLYHPPSQSEEGFEAELARTINQADGKTNFLISMREDELSKLDRFKGRISNLLGNMLRVEHLDCAAAEEAIRKPLEAYALPDGARVGVEDALVKALLQETQSGKVSLSEAGRTKVDEKTGDPADGRIETPLLQMVLTRLWDEETKAGSRVLREATLRDKLGGVDKIVRTHLDDVMQEKLSAAERETASSVFRYLVTPSGSKIAQEPAALARWAGRNESEIKSVLNKLSGDVRIVREVQIPNQSARFEVFHDVLGPAILEWGRKYEVHAQAAREQEVSRARRMRIGLLALSVVVIAMAGLLYWGVRQKTLVLDSQRKLEERLKEIHRLRETEEYMRRGILFSQQIKYDAAIAELRKALELDPDNASAYGFLGYAQMRHDYIPDAIASLQKSISLDPNNAQPHFNLADAYTQNRQFDSAIRELKEAFKLDCCVYCGATKTLALKAQKAFGAAASASFIKDLAGVSCVCPDKTIPCTPVSNPEP